MPRWRGSHEEIREFLESSVCDHLSAAEREHLELLIWWDDHRDLRIKEVDSPAEQERIIAKAEEISLRAHIRESRHNALEWLRVCYSDLDDNDALWRTLQRSIVEKVKLNNYFSDDTIKFALRDFPDTGGCIIFSVRMRSKRNSQCRKSVVATFSTPGYWVSKG